MKGFIYKIKKFFKSFSYETKVGLTTLLLTFLFFGSIGITKKWWNEDSSSKLSYVSTSSKEEVISSTVVASEIDEIFITPYPSNCKVATYFYNLEDNKERQEKSLIFYEGKYIPSNGINVTNDNKEFEVYCALSGVVKRKLNDPLYGNLIIIESLNDVLISYSSLNSSLLSEGDKVDKGDLIGYAGECAYGNFLNSKHLYLEVYYKEQPIDPLKCFNKPLKEIIT